ncbi:MAG: hypothetical protein Kow0079_02460 [Vicingaceae bacterium]
MRYLLAKIFSLILFLNAFNPVLSQDNCFPSKPNPPKAVNDFADALSASEESLLEQKLRTFTDTTSTAIVIVTVKDICGYDKADYTITLAEKWGIGQKGKDNGVLIMVKPFGGRGDRHAFIAVGYGLEGVIPDAIAKRIVEYEMLPEFKNNNFYEGLNNAVDILAGLASGEFSADDYSTKIPAKVLVFLAFFLFLIVFIFLANIQRVRKYAVGHDLPFWTAFWILSSSNKKHGGFWNDFNSGGGSFGGGGFGGYGGGSFGGGGAGGSW